MEKNYPFSNHTFCINASGERSEETEIGSTEFEHQHRFCDALLSNLHEPNIGQAQIISPLN